MSNDMEYIVVTGGVISGVGKGITASAIHGNKSQGARTKALAGFKAGSIRVLVATDIAARGLDIPLLPHVINFELPNVPEDYVHRIGRTGRAGASGEALSLVSADEVDYVRGIERLLGETLKTAIIEGFEPSNAPSEKADKPQQRGNQNWKNKSKGNRNRSSGGGDNSSRKRPSGGSSSSGKRIKFKRN